MMDLKKSELLVLRHVVLNGEKETLKHLLKASQHKATEWKLNTVVMFNPSTEVYEAMQELDSDSKLVQRESECINSILSINDNNVLYDWSDIEFYTWC